MLLKQLVLAVIGASFGLLAAGGVFTVFVTIGLIPRFAGKTHTGRDILVYEECVSLGSIAGCLFSLFPDFFEAGRKIWKTELMSQGSWLLLAHILLTVFGVFAGMFIGCLALAIAEMLNSIPIFLRRVGFRHGLGIAILMIAIGKTVGSLFYFITHVYLFGGI